MKDWEKGIDELLDSVISDTDPIYGTENQRFRHNVTEYVRSLLEEARTAVIEDLKLTKWEYGEAGKGTLYRTRAEGYNEAVNNLEVLKAKHLPKE